MLCMAAYTVAVSVEKWNLHKRISLNVLLTIGISSSRCLFPYHSYLKSITTYKERICNILQDFFFKQRC